MSEQKQPLINNGGASYRESLDEDLDPRYATESYQHQPSSNNVVFDAASAVESQQPSRGASTWQQQQQHQQPTSFQGGSGGGGGGLSHSFGTSQAWSLSSICAIAWALPPFSSAFVLIWETENDLARFHAYQAGLSGVGLIVLLWILRTVLGLKTIGLLVGMGAYGWFWVNASTANKSAPSLSRNPYLPHIGDVASRWVGEE
ncbi:hypothetical protein PHSY_000278 [Pseudozyma hubeiensis SY62]|uniref:Uncharacterized protein n=1 Tax=Pseudozyma hubeiensis (strain SY62) TaxID=1305764 RepID=R9NW12_PSEHS|nr:hypothetical protein PHSY_000278 [Pseudozyma hubeiensis SY62]GAC92723.1 hypothetical protein PHSY_000278 [Pseudozyma hubeiensis SY62]